MIFFLCLQKVTSVLTKLETPLGPDYIPDPRVIERARQEDLDRAMTYDVTFRLNSRDQVIFDRAVNTANMLKVYYADVDFGRRIDWNPDDPNVLELTMPGGMAVRTRVTRRCGVLEAATEATVMKSCLFPMQILSITIDAGMHMRNGAALHRTLFHQWRVDTMYQQGLQPSCA